MRTWAARLGYLFVSVLPIVLLTKELSARRLPGRFVYPDYFYLFALLFHLQEGLFVGLTLTLVGLIAVRLANHWLRFAIYFPIVFWIVWLVIWASVRSRLALAFLISSPRQSVRARDRSVLRTFHAVAGGRGTGP